MNIADYFKAKPDKPVDAIIEELTKDNKSFIDALYNVNKSETDSIADGILHEIGDKGKLPLKLTP
jgi:hypothetical protein